MSNWFSNTIKAVGKGVKDTGHFIGSVQNNPLVKGIEAAGLAATGVGLPAAAALMGGAGAIGGALRPGGGLKGALTQGAQGAAIGAGGSLVGQGVRAVGSLVHGAGAAGAAGEAGGAVDAAGNAVADGAGQVATQGGGLLESLGGLGGLAKLGLGAGTLYEGIQNNNKSNQLMDEGMAGMKDDYASRAQYRDAAAPKLNAVAPDLSALFADSGNPYKRRGIPAVGRMA